MRSTNSFVDRGVVVDPSMVDLQRCPLSWLDVLTLGFFWWGSTGSNYYALWFC